MAVADNGRCAQKAKASLLESKRVYMENKDRITADSLEPPEQAEAQYTLTMYYLAQVHGHLGESEDAAQSIVTTLRRQLLPSAECDQEVRSFQCLRRRPWCLPPLALRLVEVIRCFDRSGLRTA